jgi:hypothetical protein
MNLETRPVADGLDICDKAAIAIELYQRFTHGCGVVGYEPGNGEVAQVGGRTELRR